MFKKIKAGIKERREEREAVKEIENVKQERELERLAAPIAKEYDVSLETAKKYVLAQLRKDTIKKAKTKRDGALKGVALKIGEGARGAK